MAVPDVEQRSRSAGDAVVQPHPTSTQPTAPITASTSTFTVTAGAIELLTAASTVYVALSIVADFESLDLHVQASSIRDKHHLAGSPKDPAPRRTPPLD